MSAERETNDCAGHHSWKEGHKNANADPLKPFAGLREERVSQSNEDQAKHKTDYRAYHAGCDGPTL